MHLADHIDTARNIAPLIRTANLELYVIFAVQMFIIDSLENLIGKFRKRDALLPDGWLRLLLRA
jgi:hypothetical protein